jgi:membrane-associated protease RseP (regulator of RpoE activity)
MRSGVEDARRLGTGEMIASATRWAAVSVVLAGCASVHQPPSSTSRSTSQPIPLKPTSSSTPIVVKPVEPAARTANPVTEPAEELATFEVRDSAISDFGMSLRTNLEVKWGDFVTWMRVTAIDPGSSADAAGLHPGDRILAIDGTEITKLDRDAMLAALFYRKKGDRIRVLTLGVGQPLPRFVTLRANRPDR